MAHLDSIVRPKPFFLKARLSFDRLAPKEILRVFLSYLGGKNLLGLLFLRAAVKTEKPALQDKRTFGGKWYIYTGVPYVGISFPSLAGVQI